MLVVSQFFFGIAILLLSVGLAFIIAPWWDDSPEEEKDTGAYHGMICLMFAIACLVASRDFLT